MKTEDISFDGSCDPIPSAALPPVRVEAVVGRGRFVTCHKHGWDALDTPCPRCAAGDAPRHCHKHGWSHMSEGCPQCTAGR